MKIEASLQQDLATSLVANDFIVSTAPCVVNGEERLAVSTHASDGTFLKWAMIRSTAHNDNNEAYAHNRFSSYNSEKHFVIFGYQKRMFVFNI